MDKLFEGIDEQSALRYRQKFESESIALDQLDQLSLDLLKNDLGIEKAGHRLRILRNAQALTKDPVAGQTARAPSAPTAFLYVSQLPKFYPSDAGGSTPAAAVPKKDHSPPKKSRTSSARPSKKRNGNREIKPPQSSSPSISVAPILPDENATPEPPLLPVDRTSLDFPRSLASSTASIEPATLNLGSPIQIPYCYNSIEERNSLFERFGIATASTAQPEGNQESPQQATTAEEAAWALNAVLLPWISLADLSRRTRDVVSKFVEFLFAKFKPARPHQLEAVTKLVVDVVRTQSDAAKRDTKKNYLLQHAAGSGKSLTIAALVDILSRMAVDDAFVQPRDVYDLILIVLDRNDLVEQLSNTISTFASALGRSASSYVQTHSTLDLYEGIFKRSTDSTAPKILVTTIQKFGALTADQVASLSQKLAAKRVAIVADEAHRSHGHKYTRELHELLTGQSNQSSLLTYFSFSCTPIAQALMTFGVPYKDFQEISLAKDITGTRYRPFHTYSLKAAIRDHVILDVLQSYMSVRVGTEFVARCDESKIYAAPDEAASALLREANTSPMVVSAKARYIVEHFDEIRRQFGSDFAPKAMVVVSGRPQVVMFRNALTSAVIELLKPERQFDVVAAFSPYEDENSKALVSESDIRVNGQYAGSLSLLLRKFQDPRSAVHMIVVAEKLQTGFDEPALTALYLDKVVTNVSAVQTLGRLARIHPVRRFIKSVPIQPFLIFFLNSRVRSESLSSIS